MFLQQPGRVAAKNITSKSIEVVFFLHQLALGLIIPYHSMPGL